MLILYHGPAVRHQCGSQQLLQLVQGLAVGRRNIDHAHRATDCPVKHPLRHLTSPAPAMAVQAASEHCRAASHQRTVNRDLLAVARMPRITEFAEFGNMGLVLLTCIITAARICRWTETRRLNGKSNYPKEAWSLRFRKLAGCIIAIAVRLELLNRCV